MAVSGLFRRRSLLLPSASPRLLRALSSVALNYRIVEPSRAAEDVQSSAAEDAPPLVLLHGLFGSSSNFTTVGRRCADSTGRRVILPDLRNHGASPWAGDCSFEAMAQDLVDMLDKVGVSTVCLCGHSLGGKVVMVTSLLHPDRIEGVVCVDIAPVRLAPPRAASHT